jgi:Chaperone of endosialidase
MSDEDIDSTPSTTSTPAATSGTSTGSGYMNALAQGMQTMGAELSNTPQSGQGKTAPAGISSAINNIGGLSASNGGSASMPSTQMPSMELTMPTPQAPAQKSSSGGGMMGMPSGMSGMMGGGGGGSSAGADAGAADAGADAGAADAAADAFSDKRAKKNIKEVGKDKVDEFLDSITPKSYDFKNPADGKHVAAGMMAQDLQKSQLGSDTVKETTRGKMVDTKKLSMMMAPVFAAKIKSLEDKLDQALSNRFKKAK